MFLGRNKNTFIRILKNSLYQKKKKKKNLKKPKKTHPLAMVILEFGIDAPKYTKKKNNYAHKIEFPFVIAHIVWHGDFVCRLKLFCFLLIHLSFSPLVRNEWR